MAYMMCHGNCVNCGNLFSFNPDTVPSVRVKGLREPICKPCVDWANAIRQERGLPLIPIMRDSYEAQEVA